MPFVKVEEQQIYYQLSEPETPNGLTFFFIHGLGSSHAFYASIIPSLAEKGYRCLAVDTPGSGSSVPNLEDRSTKWLSKAFKVVLEKLKIHTAKTILVGHSMGAILAAELPIEALGTVLIGPVHPTPALAEVFNKRIEAVEKNGLEFLADSIPGAATGSKSTALQRAFIRALILSQNPENYISLCRTIATAEVPRYGETGSSKSPLLIIAGSDDKTSPLEGCQTVLKSWNTTGSKHLQVLDGVGHWHCIEDPEEVLRLLEFLAVTAVADPEGVTKDWGVAK